MGSPSSARLATGCDMPASCASLRTDQPRSVRKVRNVVIHSYHLQKRNNDIKYITIVCQDFQVLFIKCYCCQYLSITSIADSQVKMGEKSSSNRSGLNEK